MLNIIICARENKDIVDITKKTKWVIRQSEIDAEVRFVSSNVENIIKEKLDVNSEYIFILEFIKGKQNLFKDIRSKFKFSYIVFLSNSYENIIYALKGNLMPSGFLIKPFDEDELKNIIDDIYSDYINKLGDSSEYISISTDGKIHNISVNEILYFEASSKKINLVTNNQQISYYGTLKVLEERFKDEFIRCHKAFLVNKKKIVKCVFSDMYVELDNKSQVPISRSFKENLKQIINMV